VEERQQLRQHVASVLEQEADAIVGQAVELLAFAERSGIAAGEGERLARPLLHLMAMATREGTLADSHGAMTEARRRVTGTPTAGAFELVYLMERVATDLLAADESFGAGSATWSMVAQLVRRASFDVLAAIVGDLGRGSLIDPLTTLYTRGVFLEVLDKEIQRSERLNRPFALMLFDVDRLAVIASEHGFGLVDRLLERMGIVIHSYFREQDWVSRSGDDEFAVLLPETQRDAAATLAEDVRETIETRLAVRDHRSDLQVPVTVSVALLAVENPDSSLRARALLNEAEDALRFAKQAGGNRVEIVDVESGSSR